ncbi:MAG TPA: type II toxin-antitoxin system RelE/ParE family toxin [Thermomicrobiales bacterium]|nr:type II toxin-antitoxin system RelE/ParE family toxin [Thermomicrobiales bacterium]
MSDAFGFIITPAALKRLKRHRHAESTFVRAFEALVHQPDIGEELKGNLAGYRALKIHVKGSGEYRALYDVDEHNRTVVIHWIGTRENFYEEAERHLFG